MNNRSLGLDSECDIFIDARRPGNDSAIDNIKKLRISLLAEHCGQSTERIEMLLDQGETMHDIIMQSKGSGRRLRPLELPELSEAEKAIAENSVLDPENPDEMFEPFASPGLFTRVRMLRKPKG